MRISRTLALIIAAVAGACMAIAVAQRASGAPALSDVLDPDVAVPASGNMAAMQRPQSATDKALVSNVQAEIDSLVTPGATTDTDVGQPDMNTLRVLLHPAGSDDVIYAFQTDAGRTCIALQRQSAGCMSGFPASEINWVILNGRASSPSTIWGAAADGVTGVDALTPSGTYPLHVENNAFYGEVPRESGNQGLVFNVSYANGTSATVHAAPPPGAHISK
jgi:hypothetical protein